MEETLLNIPRLYTALAEWLFCLLYIIFAPKRFKGWKLISIIIGFLIILSGTQYIAGVLPLSFWVPGMLFAVLMMFIFIYVSTKMTLLTTGFFTVLAFVLAEFVASFEWQLEYFIRTNTNLLDALANQIIFLVFIYGFMFFIAFLIESRYASMKEAITKNDLVTYLVIASLVFFISNISFLNINTPLSGESLSEIFYIRTLVDFAGVVLLYTHREHKIVSRSQLEVLALQNILDRQYDNYLKSQASIDRINHKYHDLKHQIAIIRSEEDADKKERYLDEMEEGINKFDAQYNTGNSVLDTILTSKNLTCIENDINFTCVADGSKLDYISVLDITSIFGNALDNAIENVSLIENPEMRIIKVAVFSQNDLLFVRVENYYTNELSFKEGVFQSTKNDRLNHGYGIKSIKSIVEKYSGSLDIKTYDNWFRLIIMIPIVKTDTHD